MLHVLMVLAFVSVGDFIRARLFPYTLAFLHAFDKDARVGVPVLPSVLTVAIGFTIVILAEVDITVSESV